MTSPLPAPVVPAPATPGSTEAPLRPWDPLVRLTHWGIVVAVALNALVTEEGDVWHVWVGTAMAALLVLRLLWGFVGPAEARFSAFPPSPARAIVHLRDIAAGRHPRHASHNGLGALMAYALWATLALIAVTGLAMSGFPPEAEGGDASVISFLRTAVEAPARARDHDTHERDQDGDHARDHDGDRHAEADNAAETGAELAGGTGARADRREAEGDERLEEIHEGAVNLLYALAFVHLLGVAFETVRSGPGVLRRMTGRHG